MTSSRPKLSLRTVQPLSDEEKASLLTEALESHRCVRWTYNRTVMHVAPQLLYHRNDSLHCDAIVMERQGLRPQELKLGAFKVAGLRELALSDESFTPSSEIDVADPRYRDGIVLKA